MRRQQQKGFTIIELMIATVVFSVVLLVVMGAIIQFGRIYYKGIIQSRTQERARAISEEIASHIQFGKIVTPIQDDGGGIAHLCAGGKSFTFALKQQRVGSQHGLVENDGCGQYSNMNVATLDPGARELLGERMQLVSLTVTPSPADDRYKVAVRVVYGENGDFEGDDPVNACKAVILGGQFCAISELTTTVTKRLK